MTSKRRRKAREWMREQAEKLEASVFAERVNTMFLVEQERSRWQKIVSVDDDEAVFPAGRITQPVIRVTYRDEDPSLVRSAILVAKQLALALPDGTKVVWWGWELKQ